MSALTTEELKALQATCGCCIKVNILHDEDGGGGEGIWAICCTPEDRAIYDADTEGDKLSVYMCNAALIGQPSYGLKATFVTRGSKRPEILCSELLGQLAAQDS